MKRIFNHLLTYWEYLGGILLLILLGLYCAVEISSSAQGIRQTGIQNSGVEYMVAETLSSDAWQRVQLYMSDSEKLAWQESYEIEEDGQYHLQDIYKQASTLADLEQTFLVPQAVVWEIWQMGDAYEDLLNESDLSATDYLEIRDLIEELLEEEGSDKLEENALAFVQEESEAAGESLRTYQNSYISRTVFWMVFYVLVFVGSVIGLVVCLEHVQRWIGRRIEDLEMQQAEQFLLYVLCLLTEGILLLAVGCYCLSGEKAAPGWYLPGGILLLAGLAVVWVIRTRPGLEEFCQRISFADRRKRIYMRAMRRLAGILFPAMILAAGFLGMVSVKCSGMLDLLFADAAIILSVFLLPDIAQAADSVSV